MSAIARAALLERHDARAHAGAVAVCGRRCVTRRVRLQDNGDDSDASVSDSEDIAGTMRAVCSSGFARARLV